MRIFLTGGTGSLGKAILKRAEADQWDAIFTVYSRDEVKQGQVKARFPRHNYVLGNITDYDDLEDAMAGHDLVIHTAAYKQVPAAEVNTWEAIASNVIGSCNVARAAIRTGVKRVVGISTDKACAPINTYGQTKALMEKRFADACLKGLTHFVCVRYGNVLGSRGSIVPLFERQAREGKDLTITDPGMTRFWLTLSDAVDLVCRAMGESQRGTVIVPKAPASNMRLLAMAVSECSPVTIVGTRAGEKKHEALIHAGEAMHTDDCGDFFRVFPAYSQHKGNLPEGYEYRSDTALHLTVGELRGMIARSEQEATE